MKKYKILIIDDEVEVINSVVDIMEPENSNYIFYRALNGVDGINVAKKFIPDLILTDWEMPVMSGICLIENLKKSTVTKDIPVIMLTGIMTSSDNLKTALNTGAIDFIRKPIDKIELTARIKSMLILADSYKEVISLKDKELTSVALNINKNNKFNTHVIDKLNEIKTKFKGKSEELQNELNELIHLISMEVKSDSWSKFRSYFNNVQPSFSQHLLERFPEISSAEVKLATLLRLNLTTKEIASITFITPGSIRTARNRLRKKMNLSPNENLSTFLMSI